MSRVVFQVVDALHVGGAERMVVDVSNELSGRDWEVHLIATRDLGPLADEVRPEVEVHCLDRASRWDLGGLRRFSDLVREHRPEIVHAHGWSSLQFCTLALLGVRGAPALVFHDHRPSGLQALGMSYRIAAWPLTRAHVAVDRVLLEPPLRTRRRAVRQVIPNGIPLDRFRRKADYSLSVPPRLVLLANLRPQKDHPVFISALAQLAGWNVETSADLIGALPDATYEEACRTQILAEGLGESVTIAGPQQEPGRLLASYDVGILSSSTESGPIALIEYMAAGLPFVVTDVGEVPASLPSALRRWVVPPRDPEALAVAIRDLLTLPQDERRSMAEAGRAFVREHLSIDRTVDALLSVYDEVTLHRAR